MAELWSSYYHGTKKLMYVVDAANMSQLASATLLLIPLLSHPHLRKTQVAIFRKLVDWLLHLWKICFTNAIELAIRTALFAFLFSSFLMIAT